MGRPKFEITKKVCDKAKDLASQGLTLKQIAISMGMGETTLYKNKKEFTEFTKSIEHGRVLGIKVATSGLFDLVKEKDLSAIKYFLNNRDNDNWKDRQTTETTITAKVGLYELEDDELDRRIEELKREEQRTRED